MRNTMDIAHDETQARYEWEADHLYCDQCDEEIGPMTDTQGPVYCRHCLGRLQEDAEMEAGWAWDDAMGWMMAAAQREDEWRTLMRLEAPHE